MEGDGTAPDESEEHRWTREWLESLWAWDAEQAAKAAAAAKRKPWTVGLRLPGGELFITGVRAETPAEALARARVKCGAETKAGFADADMVPVFIFKNHHANHAGELS